MKRGSNFERNRFLGKVKSSSVHFTLESMEWNYGIHTLLHVVPHFPPGVESSHASKMPCSRAHVPGGDQTPNLLT